MNNKDSISNNTQVKQAITNYVVKRLQEEYTVVPIRAIQLSNDYEELKNWINRFKFHGYQIMALPFEDHIILKWFTKDYEISIKVFKKSEEYPDGYMDASFSMRAPNPGETWLRSNSLASGPYEKFTWNAIIRDIADLSILQLEIPI